MPPTIEKCKVKAGFWNDFYFAETFDSPKLIDIDHVVPLKHAFENGAKAWTQEQKKIFANDPDNLVITSRKANRTKGANDFTSWSPLNRDYACAYMERWYLVKRKYALAISEKEEYNRRALACDARPPARLPSSPVPNGAKPSVLSPP